MDRPREVVELTTSSDDENYDTDDDIPRASPHRTQVDSIDLDTFFGQGDADGHHAVPDIDQDAQGASYEFCLKEITEIFPDISHDHVQHLYDKHNDALIQAFANGREFSQSLIEQILDAGKYPKEKDRLREIKELKRKREDPESYEEEAARWKDSAVNLKLNPSDYTKVA